MAYRGAVCVRKICGAAKTPLVVKYVKTFGAIFGRYSRFREAVSHIPYKNPPLSCC
ncbi:hypothetical protein AGR8A_Cc30805 [Agrobacterium fabrum str. J-07]|nr:hypothetical protein AGR8A_Cc30805 [Agrobacterium fabrum str. J-07]